MVARPVHLAPHGVRLADARRNARARERRGAQPELEVAGLSLDYAADFGEDWSGSVRLGLNAARFDEADAAFLARRDDCTRSAGLTLSRRVLSWEGNQPVLMLDWSRTDSTIPLYDRKLLSVRIGLRRLF
ncbi:MAG: surface lipoprotein assembly modifier [Rhodospirillales bacterium]|nr:surface lipoprotein assembly modifier [Rhodospirillales bacterium]